MVWYNAGEEMLGDSEFVREATPENRWLDVKGSRGTLDGSGKTCRGGRERLPRVRARRTEGGYYAIDSRADPICCRHWSFPLKRPKAPLFLMPTYKTARKSTF